jgi:hypothetical protein
MVGYNIKTIIFMEQASYGVNKYPTLFDESTLYTPVDETFYSIGFSYDNYWMLTEDSTFFKIYQCIKKKKIRKIIFKIRKRNINSLFVYFFFFEEFIGI